MPSAPHTGPPGKPVDVSTLDPTFVAESNAAMILAITGVFHFLALIVVAMRLYTRACLIRAMGIDDWTMLAAVVVAVGQYAVWIIEVDHGLGRHQIVIPRDELIALKHAGFFQVLLNFCDLCLIKISIAFALMRLTRARWVSWALWCLIRFNIFTNVALAVLPVPIVWSLQMKMRTRIYIVGILSLGWVAVAIGLVKSVYQVNAATDTDSTFRQSIQFFGYLESQLGVIAASIPALKPLLNRCLGREDTSYGAGQSPATGYYARGGTNRTAKRSKPHSHIYVSSQTGADEFELHMRQSGRDKVGMTSTIYHEPGSQELVLHDDDSNKVPLRSPSNSKSIIMKRVEVVHVREKSR
ncbi:uncharacterized protein PG998_008502 [Apiospora kogelbergensis]|uniref:uncharacterized protein n=1 Tax=Apiospora kogelbergensis TaxID=1337665 RepID=UPI003130F647